MCSERGVYMVIWLRIGRGVEKRHVQPTPTAWDKDGDKEKGEAYDKESHDSY